MTEFQQYTLLSRKEFDRIVVSIYEESLVHGYIKPNEFVELPDVLEALEYIQSFGTDKKYMNLFEFGEHGNVSDEVREWAAKSEANQTIADAMVLNSLAQKLVMNFYLKFHKPQSPTKAFRHIEEAMKWLEGHKNKKPTA